MTLLLTGRSDTYICQEVSMVAAWGVGIASAEPDNNRMNKFRPPVPRLSRHLHLEITNTPCVSIKVG